MTIQIDIMTCWIKIFFLTVNAIIYFENKFILILILILKIFMQIQLPMSKSLIGTLVPMFRSRNYASVYLSKYQAVGYLE